MSDAVLISIVLASAVVIAAMTAAAAAVACVYAVRHSARGEKYAVARMADRLADLASDAMDAAIVSPDQHIERMAARPKTIAARFRDFEHPNADDTRVASSPPQVQPWPSTFTGQTPLGAPLSIPL